MQCESESGDPIQEFLQRFDAKVIGQRIPILGNVELTSRCNLNCVHCYLGLNSKTKNCDIDQQAELSTGQWINLIDQATEAGCLYLVITGGEAMLRPDFCELYRHACQNGLLVAVFSNGTLITDQIIEIFKSYPPYSVEVSLYGSTASTYEKITGVHGSFNKCIQGINKLKCNGIRFKLKTVVLTHNFDDLSNIEKISDDFGVPFRYDGMIFSCFDGNRTPLKYRISPEDLIEKEFSSRSIAEQWVDLYQRMADRMVSSSLYQCGAGLSLFYINAYGLLQPCLMSTRLTHDLLGKSFKDVWYSKNFTKFREHTKAPLKCRGCNLKILCGYCPGFFMLESENGHGSLDFLCDIAQKRKKAILNFQNREMIKNE